MRPLTLKQFLSQLVSSPKELAESYRFFVDAGSLLRPEVRERLDEELLGMIVGLHRPLIVPLSVKKQLTEINAAPKSVEMGERASEALKFIQKHLADRRIEVVGNPDDPPPRVNLVDLYKRFRTQYRFVVFSTDFPIASDILYKRKPGTHFAKLVQPSSSGELILIEDMEGLHANQKALHAKRRAERNQNQTAPSQLRFGQHDKPRPIDDTPVGGSQILSEGFSVRDQQNRSLRLGRAVASGGEGEIFDCGHEFVAKIYFPERRTKTRREKLELMCSRRPQALAQVAWPVSLLCSEEGSFVGYLMPKAKGVRMQDAVFAKARLEKHFPKWTRADLVQLALTYAIAVRDVQRPGLLVGDINPMNALIQSPEQIVIVDADSFQVEDFPCPVGMATFRAPEITEPDFSLFLRTERHEAFALASLLFMILMGGKSPYSYQGGGDPAENIRAGNFPYAKDAKAIPAGAFRYIWSYFPPRIKEAFSSTFANPSPAGRPTAQQWVGLLQDYLKFLKSCSSSDDSLALWPGSFRPWAGAGVVQMECGECGTAFQTSAKDAENKRRFTKILCGPCREAVNLARDASRDVRCASCQKHYTLERGRLAGGVFYCPTCTAPQSSLDRGCPTCGNVFRLTPSEVSFFWGRNLSLPKRCPDCRKATRA